MTGLLLYAIFLTIVLIQGRRQAQALTFSNPIRFAPGEPELPPTEAARVRDWVEALTAAGYALHSSHSVVTPQTEGRPRGPRMWYAFYQREDRTSMALLQASRVEAPNVPVIWTLTASLVSRLVDGRRVTTSNPVSSPRFPSPPGYLGRRLPGASVPRLVEAHQAQLAELGLPVELGDPVEEQATVERDSYTDSVKRGILVETGEGTAVMSGAAFVGALLRMGNPITGEPRAVWINVLLALVILGTGAGCAHAWVGPPPGSSVALGAVFAVLVAATCVAFPRTIGFAVVLPQVAGLEAWWESDSVFAQVGALGAGLAVGAFINGRRSSVPAGEHRWLSTLRLVTVAAGLVAAVALYTVLRMPREDPLPPYTVPALAVVVGSGMLIGLLLLVLSYVPSVRTHVVFQVASIVSDGLFPAGLAFLVSVVDSAQSREENTASAKAIHRAVRAHVNRTGSLPATLDALVPTDLQRAPVVSVGWPGAKFDYEVAGPTTYFLSHRSSEGRIDASFGRARGRPGPRLPTFVAPHGGVPSRQPAVPPPPPDTTPTAGHRSQAWPPVSTRCSSLSEGDEGSCSPTVFCDQAVEKCPGWAGVSVGVCEGGWGHVIRLTSSDGAAFRGFRDGRLVAISSGADGQARWPCSGDGSFWRSCKVQRWADCR